MFGDQSFIRLTHDEQNEQVCVDEHGLYPEFLKVRSFTDRTFPSLSRTLTTL